MILLRAVSMKKRSKNMRKEELLKKYAEGERDFRNADLEGADLRWADLEGANFCGADLDGAYLSKEQVEIVVQLLKNNIEE